MILFEILGKESDPIYQEQQASNLDREYQFVRSIVSTAIKCDRQFLSQAIIKAINFHAIACLHVNAGKYRPCEVNVRDSNGDVSYKPPKQYRVDALMDDFVNTVNRNWGVMDAIQLSAYVLWRLNWIHPFINGNGRTARASCHFVLCVHTKTWVGRKVILPELLRKSEKLYLNALRESDDIEKNTKNIEKIVIPVSNLITKLLTKDIN